ncbi:putative bifunctional diguanylate cyclase/phosphodiesterase [Mycolicibacterium sp. CBM1]
MSKTALTAVAAVVCFVVFVVWILSGVTHGAAFTAVDGVLLAAVAIVAALASAWTVRAVHGRARAAWAALAFGLAAYAAGEVVWAYLEVGVDEGPFPSLADAFFLTFPAGACVALLLFRNRSVRSSDWRILLDGVIVAGSLFAASWALVMSELYRAGAASRFEFVLLMAYPVWDVVLVTTALVVIASAGPAQRPTMTLVTLGLTAMALADSGYAYLSARGEYFSGNIVDIGWVAGLLLLTVAAVAAREAGADDGATDELPGWASVWVPYAPLMVALVVVAAKPPEVASSPMFPLGVLLLVAVLLRQALAVSENRRLLSQIAEQSSLDPLTGLGNRALFNDRLTEAMQAREADGGAVALIVMDLNDFKLVNDSLGHPVGDELLHLAADRVAECVRAGDIVARLGGDEFAVLICDEVDHAELVAHRVLEVFDRPFDVGGQELLIRPSVGFAVAAADRAQMSADELLRRADVAMYSAKRSRGAAVCAYNAEMRLADGRGAGQRHPADSPAPSGAAVVRLLGELRQAIEKVELTLVYQPKYDLRSVRIMGVEALVRWPHPQRGLLGPDEFLPLVRRYGLMGVLTEFVVSKALDDAVRWHALGFEIPVAVNLFAPSMANPDLPVMLSQALSTRGLTGAALTVEITEDLFLENMDRTRLVLTTMRSNGIRIAIDDVGTGYSVLSYLRDLPIDEVKLDRDFIAPILVDRRAATVVRAVLNLAAELGLDTVAEGIEDAETAVWLRDHGCRVGQGYHFSPPLPIKDLLDVLGRDHDFGGRRYESGISAPPEAMRVTPT